MPSVITPCGGGGGGIQFDTSPQAGQWLYVETDGPHVSPSGYGIEFFDDSGNGINLAARGGGDVYLRTRGGGAAEIDSTGGIFIHEENTGGFNSITIQSTFHDLFLLARDKITIESGFDNVAITSLIGRVDVVAQDEVSLTANTGDVQIQALGSGTSLLQLVAQAPGEGVIKHEMYGYQTVELGGKPGHRFLGNSASGVGTRFDFTDIGTGAVLLRIDEDAGGTPTYHIAAGAAWVADL